MLLLLVLCGFGFFFLGYGCAFTSLSPSHFKGVHIRTAAHLGLSFRGLGHSLGFGLAASLVFFFHLLQQHDSRVYSPHEIQHLTIQQGIRVLRLFRRGSLGSYEIGDDGWTFWRGRVGGGLRDQDGAGDGLDGCGLARFDEEGGFGEGD